MASLPRPSGTERAGTARLERTASPAIHGLRESNERGKTERCADSLGAPDSLRCSPKLW